MPLYFDQFEPGDLSIDWPMILVGWQGFGSSKLSAEQVISLSVEQIGKGTREQDDIAALLANTDPSEWQTIDRYLKQTAEMQPFDCQLALRKWRLAELKALIADVLPIDEEMNEDEDHSIFYSFVYFWQDYDELPDSLSMIPDWGIMPKELVQQQQAWVQQEAISLRSNVETIR